MSFFARHVSCRCYATVSRMSACASSGTGSPLAKKSVRHASRQCGVGRSMMDKSVQAQPRTIMQGSKTSTESKPTLQSPFTSLLGRTFTTSFTAFEARKDGRDPGGKPIPTDGSYRTVYDDFQNILSSETDANLSVYSMGDEQFTLTDGLVCRSPIILLNKNVFLWNAPKLDPQHAFPNGQGWQTWVQDEKSIWSLFEMTNPRPEIVIFGTGKTVLPIPAAVKQHLNKLGIQIEAHSTRDACSTYNMLVEEQRLVAAALLPVKQNPIKRVRASDEP